jgi:hypothetical protein
MQNEHQTDRILRERLENASVPPPAFVWPGVERELRKKRRKAIFWWFTFAGLALVGTGWWMYNAPTSNPGGTVSGAPAPREATADRPLVGPDGQPLSPANQAIAHSADAVQAGSDAHPVGGRAFSAKGKIQFSQKVPELDQASVPDHTPVSLETVVTDRISYAVAPNTTPETPNVFSRASTPLLPVLMIAPKAPAPTKALQRVALAEKTIKKRQNCYDFDENSRAWLLDVYGGSLMANKQLNNYSGDLELEAYRQKRLETENRGWGYQAGVGITHVFNRHYSIGTGVQYQQFTEAMRFKDELFVQYFTENNGQDTIDATFGVKTITTYNRFGMLHIPLRVGYEWRSGRKGVHLKGGAAFNVLFWKKGSILSPDTFNPVPFNSGDSSGVEVFNPRTGLSLEGSAQFFWHFRRDTRIFAEPYYHSILKPISTETYSLQQRNHLIGLRLGVSKIF